MLLAVATATAGALARTSGEESVVRTAAAASQASGRFFVLTRRNVVVAVGGTRRVMRRLASRSRPASEPGGRLLAYAARRNELFVLVRTGGRARDAVVVLDARTLRSKRRYVLDGNEIGRGIEYRARSGLLYVFSNRPGAFTTSSGTRELAAVVTILAASTGATRKVFVVRQPDRRDWWIYRGIVSGDERMLWVSYHGSETTGADWVLLADGIPTARCAVETGPGEGCQPRVHGNVERYGRGVIAATGHSSAIVQLGRSGEIERTWNARLPNNHLMEFAISPADRTLAALGSCLQTGGLSRVALVGGRVRVLVPASRPGFPNRRLCGDRVLVIPGRRLLVARAPAGFEPPLVVVDARNGRVVARMPAPRDAADVVSGS